MITTGSMTLVESEMTIRRDDESNKAKERESGAENDRVRERSGCKDSPVSEEGGRVKATRCRGVLSEPYEGKK